MGSISGRTPAHMSALGQLPLRGFAASVLPHLSELAIHYRAELEPLVEAFPVDWVFEDRVLGWVVPGFLKDISSFYEENGPHLADLVRGGAIERIDELAIAGLLDAVAVLPEEAAERVRLAGVALLRH